MKGRYGFDYVRHGERLEVPLVRRDGVAKDAQDIERVKRGESTRMSMARVTSMGPAGLAAGAGGTALAIRCDVRLQGDVDALVEALRELGL